MTKDSTTNRRAKPSAVPMEQRQPVDGRRRTEPAGDEGWDLDPASVSAEYASMVARQLALLGEDPSMFIVGWASDGIEAVEKARALRPDVTIMDVNMPRLDGLGATAAIMADTPSRNIAT